jgi:hypothetical protein
MPKLFPEELTDKDVEAVATFVQSLSTVHGAAIAGAQSAPISGGNAHDSFSRNVRHGGDRNCNPLRQRCRGPEHGSASVVAAYPAHMIQKGEGEARFGEISLGDSSQRVQVF